MPKKTAKRAKTGDLSDNAKNATIDRAAFDALLGKLLHAKPITKAEIALKVKMQGHSRPSPSSGEKRSGQR
jgi:hypothetical protein